MGKFRGQHKVPTKKKKNAYKLGEEWNGRQTGTQDRHIIKSFESSVF